MHPSRQALLQGGNNTITTHNSHDRPPHIRSQENNWRQSSSEYGSFGGSKNGGDGTLGSSTNSIPLAGRGRWGQAKAGNNVSFADQEEGNERQADTKPARQGWGERSAGAVGVKAGLEAKGRLSGMRSGVGGDIWDTVPQGREDEEQSKWGKTSPQADEWGRADENENTGSAGGWGVATPSSTEQPEQASTGWDVPAPPIPAQPRSNTSASHKPSPRHQPPFHQPDFRPRDQSAPRHQSQSQSHHSQSQPTTFTESPCVAPIRSESSGWYDYATPPPQFSAPPAQNRSDAGGQGGWAAPPVSISPVPANVPFVRENKALEIKDPNGPAAANSGHTVDHTQNQTGHRGDQVVDPEQQTTKVFDWDTPATSIQKWTRSVGEASQAEGSDEADGMDVRGSDVGWGNREDDASQIHDEESSEKGDGGWGAKTENKEESATGWDTTPGDHEQADDGWAKPVATPDDGGWGKPVSKPVITQDDGGWDQPAAPSQSTGRGNPLPATHRSVSGSSFADRDAPSYPTRSPMDERQPLGAAARGLIQRHLGGPVRGGGNMGRSSSGGRKMPELPPPETNPFDVAAGDIWSSLPAVDADEIIKPPSDSGSESESAPASPIHKRDQDTLGISKASLLPTAVRDDKVKPTMVEADNTPSRMSLASNDEEGSITIHPGQNSGQRAENFTETPQRDATKQYPGPPADMLIDFDAPEETFSPPKRRHSPLWHQTASPGSMMTRSSTLIDMDDMLELKTPITSPDRKWAGLDDPKDTNGLAHLAQGRSFQNAMDLGQLAKMFEIGYPRQH